MANYPSNIWIVTDQEFDQFTFTGGKVVYIVEDPDLRFKSHPAIITAGALLPPMEAIQAELNGNLFESSAIYERYLLSEEANMYISILIAAAIKQIPIGIMFGRDELNMQFPKMFIDFMYKAYGLVIGINGKINPYIIEDAIPNNLAILYSMNIIDYPTFMEKHPPLPINPMVISKMVIEVNPWVSDKTFNGYLEYFECIKSCTARNGGRFAIDPMVVIS
jgi:hypothetical protein